MRIKVGFGYDVHQLADGESLWLGGVEVPHYKGTVAHSDGDVLIHAICDALLGAAGLRDIGVHFPDTDDEFKGIDSKELLARTVALIGVKQYGIGNIDATLCAEKPKLKDYIPLMRETLSSIMGIESEDVSIKATTTEKLGFVGNETGMSAYAVVLLERKN
jgi:2-C-methyl-D-erythritol 2,4-cyclodiphosphate synthase